jgi:hypothetical protein
VSVALFSRNQDFGDFFCSLRRPTQQFVRLMSDGERWGAISPTSARDAAGSCEESDITCCGRGPSEKRPKNMRLSEKQYDSTSETESKASSTK